MNDPAAIPSTPPDAARDNFRHLVADVAYFGLAIPALSRFLSVYAIRLGADAMLLGWLAALPFIFQLVSSSMAGTWRRRYPDTVSAQFWPGLLYRLSFLLPALTPFFPHEWQPVWLVVSVALPALPQGIASVLFLVILREGVEGTQLSTLMSRRSVMFNITVAVGTVAMGIWLEEAPFPFSYQVMYVAAFVLVLGSQLHINHVRIIAPEPVDVPKTPSWRLLRAPAFQRVALVAVGSHAAFFSVNALIPLRLVDQLGADEAFMSIFALFELAAAAGAAACNTRIVRRTGTRGAVGIGLFGTGLAAILLVAAPTRVLTLPAAALSGGAWTLAAINIFNYFSQMTPRENLTGYSTLYNQLIALSLFLAPMAGSRLASTSLDLTAVLMLGAVARLAVGVLIPLGGIDRETRGSRRRFRRSGAR